MKMTLIYSFAYVILLGAVAHGSAHFGHIVSVVGSDAKIERKGELISASDNQQLLVNDTIMTGAESSLKVIFGDREIAILVKPSTKIKLSTSKGDLYAQLLGGAVLSSVRKSEKSPTRYKLRTRNAVMGVRGTSFYARDDIGKPTFFCPCRGKIELKTIDGQKSHLFESKHHDTPKIISTDGKSSRQKSSNQKSDLLSDQLSDPPKDFDFGHTDNEIKDLRNLLGAKEED